MDTRDIYAPSQSTLDSGEKTIQMSDFRLALIGVLVCYGAMELLYRLAWLLETYELFPSEININTFLYFLFDTFSFSLGAFFLCKVPAFSVIKSVFVIAICGTCTALISFLAITYWSYAQWGLISMFVSPTIGATFGALFGRRAYKKLNQSGAPQSNSTF